MPNRLSSGTFELSATARRAEPGPPSGETPFRVLITGDFSGRTNRNVIEPLMKRRPLKVDLDNFGSVLASLRPALDLDLAGDRRISLQFAELDDFHPDRLWDGGHFNEFRETRRKLKNPQTFAAAAAEMAARTGETPVESDNDTLARLLGERPRKAPPKPASTARAVDALLKQAVGADVVPGPDPRQAESIAALDHAISKEMRAILHHPDFQRLETAWRNVDYLVRHLDPDEELELWLLDVSLAELAADLRATNVLDETNVYRFLVEDAGGTPGTHPWAIVVALFAIEPSDENADLLARIAKIAAAAHAPFVANAGSMFLEAALSRGEPAFPNAWQAMRAMPEAQYAGLIAPRFVLRLPYGRDTDEIESFAFEEMPGSPDHAAYLWGDAPVACADLLGSSFREAGWDFSPGDRAELESLPIHTFMDAGEKRVTSCTERLLTDRAAERLLAMGVMPLAAVRDSDTARVVRFQSIADPLRPLAGRWM
jgi:type VI secretion system protein ImpC